MEKLVLVVNESEPEVFSFYVSYLFMYESKEQAITDMEHSIQHHDRGNVHFAGHDFNVRELTTAYVLTLDEWFKEF